MSLDEATEYRNALLAALGDDDPLEVLGSTVESVRALTEGVPGERMIAEPAPGEWSARHVLSHWYDTDLVYGIRIRMTLTQDRPVLVGYDQGAWAGRFGLLDDNARQTHLRWRWVRENNLRLYRSLSDEEWERVGLHAERGEESVRTMVRMLAGHDRMHLEHLASLLA
ncbi:MAG TPA: DinB family protein [Actinomycetota bacterium]|nr:DinB family protein [Actinomycetota bacterium]